MERHVIENSMIDVRWNVFEIPYEIPNKKYVEVKQLLSKCFSELVLLCEI